MPAFAAMKAMFLGLLLAVCASAGSLSCDEEYGKLCPESAPGNDLVTCLEGKDELSDSCKGEKLNFDHAARCH